LPLRTVESAFAVDSSGFGTSRFVRWYSRKYGREIDNREWVKVHLMCGTRTNVVTSVEVSNWTANDSPFFVPLVNATARHFALGEVSADKEYLSRKNVGAVDEAGGTPFIALKSNTLAPKEDSAWARMFYFYSFNHVSFLAHYHKRSNVETVFSMIKGKFGDALRSKSDTAQFNEVLCKVLCHNVCVIIQSMHELGIDPAFCAGSTLAQEVVLRGG
jgi:hypothetical protein